MDAFDYYSYCCRYMCDAHTAKGKTDGIFIFLTLHVRPQRIFIYIFCSIGAGEKLHWHERVSYIHKTAHLKVWTLYCRYSVIVYNCLVWQKKLRVLQWALLITIGFWYSFDLFKFEQSLFNVFLQLYINELSWFLWFICTLRNILKLSH